MSESDDSSSIGDDAEIDFGPISSGGVVAGMSASAGVYQKQSGFGLGTHPVGFSPAVSSLSAAGRGWGDNTATGLRAEVGARAPHASLVGGNVLGAAGRGSGAGVGERIPANVTSKSIGGAPVAWQPRAAGGSVAATSVKTSGGRGMGTATSSTDRNPPLAAASTGHTVGGWGAEDTDEDRSEVVQRHEVFANSKMSGMHFEATRGTWMQERAAPAFGNSALQGWDEDEDSDSDGEPLQVATGGSLYHGLSVLREHEAAVASDGTAASKTFAITASRLSANRFLESSQQQQQQKQQQQHSSISSARASAATTSALRYKPALVSDNSEETSSSHDAGAGEIESSVSSSSDSGEESAYERPNLLKNIRFDLNELLIEDDANAAPASAPARDLAPFSSSAEQIIPAAAAESGVTNRMGLQLPSVASWAATGSSSEAISGHTAAVPAAAPSATAALATSASHATISVAAGAASTTAALKSHAASGSTSAVQLVLQHSSSTQSANLLANVVAEKSVSDASTSHHHHHHHQQQQQQQQQHHDIKHQQDKENAAAAAQELADRRARDARLRAAELHQLDNLLGATVASSGLKHLDLRQLNLTRIPHTLCRSAAHHLVSIDISYNPLHQLPKNVHRLHLLEQLVADECRLKFLPRSLWQLPRLQVLSIRKNELQWLPPDAAKMKSMQQLIVTDNPFTSLSPALLLKLKSEESNGIEFTFETTLPGAWSHGGRVLGQEPTTWAGFGAGVLGLKELLMSQTYADVDVLTGGGSTVAWAAHSWVLHCRCPLLHSRGYLKLRGGDSEEHDSSSKAEASDLFRKMQGVGVRRHVLQIQQLTHENIMLLIWFLYCDDLPSFSPGGQLPGTLGLAPSAAAMYELIRFANDVGLERLASLLHTRLLPTAGVFFRVLNNATVAGSNSAGAGNSSSSLHSDILRALDHGIKADGFLVGSSCVIPVHASMLCLSCPCLRAMAMPLPASGLAPWKFVLSSHLTDAAVRTYFTFLYKEVVQATLSTSTSAAAAAEACAAPALPHHAGTLASMWIMGCLIGHHETIARATEMKLCSMMKAYTDRRVRAPSALAALQVDFDQDMIIGSDAIERMSSMGACGLCSLLLWLHSCWCTPGSAAAAAAGSNFQRAALTYAMQHIDELMSSPAFRMLPGEVRRVVLEQVTKRDLVPVVRSTPSGLSGHKTLL